MHWKKAIILACIFIIYIAGLILRVAVLKSKRGVFAFQSCLNIFLIFLLLITTFRLNPDYYIINLVRDLDNPVLARIIETCSVFLLFQIVYFLPSKVDLKPPRREAVVYAFINMLILSVIMCVAGVIYLFQVFSL